MTFVIMRAATHILLCLLLLGTTLRASSNYELSATYFEHKGIIKAQLRIEYKHVNNSTRDSLYLWLPADIETFTQDNFKEYFKYKQSLLLKDSMRIFHAGEDLLWEHVQGHKQLIKISIPRKLSLGDKFDFWVSYQIKVKDYQHQFLHLEHWIPQIADQDEYGWIYNLNYPMQLQQLPYSRIEVSLKLPENYQTAASGILVDDHALQWEAKRLRTTEISAKHFQSLTPVERYSKYASIRAPKTSKQYKRVIYRSAKCASFSLMADKRFYLSQQKIQQEGANPVLVNLQFSNHFFDIYLELQEEIADVLDYFRARLGPLNYDRLYFIDASLWAVPLESHQQIAQLAIVRSKTDLINQVAMQVADMYFKWSIAHDKGEHPWLTAGLSTFYFKEWQRYYRQTHPVLDPDEDLVYLQEALYAGNDLPAMANMNQIKASGNIQVPNIRSARAFSHASQYMGQNKFDEIINGFRSKYLFKTCDASCLREFMESRSKLEFNWLFDDLLATNAELDYRILSVSPGQITVRNDGNVIAPFSVSGFRNGELVLSLWFEGFVGRKNIKFPNNGLDQLRLNYLAPSPELEKQDNIWKESNFFPTMEPLQVSLFSAAPNPNKSQVFLSPTFRYNHYDKAIFGFGIYNSLYPPKTLFFRVMPEYSIGQGKAVGTYEFGFYRALAGKKRPVFQGKASYQSYHDKASRNYRKTALEGSYSFQRDWISDWRHEWSINAQDIKFQDNLDNEILISSVQQMKLSYGINYQGEDQQLDIALGLSGTTSGGRRFTTSALHRYHVGSQTYEQSLFFGANISEYSTYDFNTGLPSDPFYEEYMLGRNEKHGFWASQFLPNEGGLISAKAKKSSKYWTSYTGIVPIYKRIRFYGQGASDFNKLYYSAGFELTVVPKFLRIYLPMANEQGFTYEQNCMSSWFRYQVRLELDDAIKLAYKLFKD